MGLLILLFFILLVLNMPVAFALASSVTLYLLIDGKFPLLLVVQQMFSGLDKFVFLAIPFFILSGLIMQRGGISQQLIQFSSLLLDKIVGGLAMSASLASMFFASISGSGPATTAAIGGTMLPEMEKKGYGKEWSVAFIAVSGTMGPIIPPSITMVIYGAIAGTSIGALFIGGLLPGLLIGLALMISAYFRAKKMGIKTEPRKIEWPMVYEAFRKAIWALLMPVIIVGGILGGVFTPTEAAVVSVVYALVISGLVQRNLSMKDLSIILKDTVITSAVIMILTANAAAFAWILSAEQGPQKIIQALQSITDNKILILLLLNILLLIIGCFLDTTSALIVTVPTLLVIGKSFGIDPLHLGLIVTTNLSIGMATPPLGFTLFTACSIGRVSITKTIRPMIPLLSACLFVLILVTYFPELFLWLPKLLLN
ncbi:TRAP transporter large permease [Ammoniphilus sp. YIM 78166]|uniref:TRAP transporter large permease n=1 Tax=Ammoniphilus sp. YIM 78166 TaxID=1644106 RepID=UPI00107000E8|nr:TRAP transporter large permease [Ammoniphilus sp. YIM 78166]